MSFQSSELFLKVNELAQIMKASPNIIEAECFAKAEKLFKVYEEEKLFTDLKILRLLKIELLSEIVLDISQGFPLLRNHRWIIKMHQNYYRIEKQSLDEPLSSEVVFSMQLTKELNPIVQLKGVLKEEFTQDEFNLMVYFSAVCLSRCLV